MQKHLVRPQFATGFQKAPFGRRTIGRDHGRGHPPPDPVRQSRILAVKLCHVMLVAKLHKRMVAWPSSLIVV